MNAARPEFLQKRWDHWYRRVLPAYWIFLFCCTHFPGLQLGRGIPSSDKVAHLIAFSLLAFLFWRFAETFRRPLPAWFVGVAAMILALYATVDEYLQRFVDRRSDIADWLSGVLGMVVVLGVLEWRRRRQAGTSAPARASADQRKAKSDAR